MSKWFILAGIMVLITSGVFYSWAGVHPWAEAAAYPALNIGIILTIGFSVRLIIKGDW